MNAILSLHNVGKTYDNGVTALAGYNLEINKGEVLTLLGPSGCGKSTALRLIAGLEKPTAGAITWAALNARDDVGVVFQDATLMPWASVFDNVYLPLRLKGVARDAARSRIEEALARVRLSDFATARPRELSGGMRMRCAIARAFVTKPALILMDEPFAALDEVTRCHLNDDLLAMRRDLGATIVFVTHSVFESIYLSTRIVVMSLNRGKIVEEIEVDPTQPRNPEFRMSEAFTGYCRRASNALTCALSGAEP